MLRRGPGYRLSGPPPRGPDPTCPRRCGACARLSACLRRIRAAPLFGGLHALRVDDGRARGGLPPFFLGPDPLAQSVVDLFPGPIQSPTTIVIVDRAPGREVMGQIPPLATAPHEVDDGVYHLANVHATRTTTRLGRRDQRSDAFPLGIGKVSGVSSPSHLFVLPVNPPSHTPS